MLGLNIATLEVAQVIYLPTRKKNAVIPGTAKPNDREFVAKQNDKEIVSWGCETHHRDGIQLWTMLLYTRGRITTLKHAYL